MPALHPPFSDALLLSLQFADHPLGGLRSFLEWAQFWCDSGGRNLETDDQAYERRPTAILGIILLSHLGGVAPAALEQEIDRRLPTLGTGAMQERDAIHFPNASCVRGYRLTIRVIRRLLAIFAKAGGPVAAEEAGRA